MHWRRCQLAAPAAAWQHQAELHGYLENEDTVCLQVSQPRVETEEEFVQAQTRAALGALEVGDERAQRCPVAALVA